MSLIVLCPSRGRPDRAREAFDAFNSTKTGPDTWMVFIVDTDDPTFNEYLHLVPIVSYKHEGGGMGPPMNAACKDVAPKYDVVGFIGDDHRFRTPGWDVEMETSLEQSGGGFAYGDDGARHDIPTQVFISSKILMALGWFCLPGAKHLYLDDTWRQLGERADCLYYFPDILIEHMHPFFGKAQMDAGYEKANAPEMYAHDRAVFEAWMSGEVNEDVARVREALG